MSLYIVGITFSRNVVTITYYRIHSETDSEVTSREVVKKFTFLLP